MTPDLDALARQIIRAAENHSRYVVALAGPPGAGKSLRGQWLCDVINQRLPGHAGLVPMDGYHFDNAVLGEQQVSLKGAPHTFDVEGLRCDLERIRQATHSVAVPVFDRPLDLARAGGRLITPEQHIVIVEGNYLLLDGSPGANCVRCLIGPCFWRSTTRYWLSGWSSAGLRWARTTPGHSSAPTTKICPMLNWLNVVVYPPTNAGISVFIPISTVFIYPHCAK